ncbi:MAG: phosphate acetyltransferase [Hahellaceae bacterium]|nr:phosphate acetyltransferase [Hahellaceae bacterium]
MAKAKVFFLAPVSSHVGLTSVCLGVLRALDSAGLRVAFFKPISQSRSGKSLDDRTVIFARNPMGLTPCDPLSLKHALRRISENQTDLLMEEILENYHDSEENVDVVIAEGLVDTGHEDYAARLNVEIARTLNAEVILVAAPGRLDFDELEEQVGMAAQLFDSPQDPDVIGCILNKVCAPESSDFRITDHQNHPRCDRRIPDYHREVALFRSGRMKLIAAIAWQPELVAPRVSDILTTLSAEVINPGEMQQRRILQVTVVARTLPNMLESLRSGTLIVTPGDREDIIVAASMAALIGVPLAGILLTGGLVPDRRTQKLCMPAMDTGLPVLSTQQDTYHTANMLSRLDSEVPVDDYERIESVIHGIVSRIDIDWLAQRVQISRPLRLSPAAFRYQITQRARAAAKTIVLPEGNEPRTVQAAIICHQRQIADCILIGKTTEIQAVAEAQGLHLPDSLRIIEPDQVRQRYVAPMVALRQHKGLTPQMADAQLEDTVVLATMMLAMDEVDGLVSGAVHTTANTVRPALQLIKSRPGSSVVSSVFFMCLPDQVVVYGDCAINPDPTADELADIALQCADSAILMGIEPKVAMLSYSTGTSGTGSDVDKVRQATEKAKSLRPDLLIDGPLQYDAAVTREVAATKAPGSQVAGQATVFVFPDLNTGNTTYKAVQRSANVVSMGPMLQGLKKPVNDLSRGALVDDIVYTIALTAIQATQNTSVMD